MRLAFKTKNTFITTVQANKSNHMLIGQTFKSYKNSFFFTFIYQKSLNQLEINKKEKMQTEDMNTSPYTCSCKMAAFYGAG